MTIKCYLVESTGKLWYCYDFVWDMCAIGAERHKMLIVLLQSFWTVLAERCSGLELYWLSHRSQGSNPGLTGRGYCILELKLLASFGGGRWLIYSSYPLLRQWPLIKIWTIQGNYLLWFVHLLVDQACNFSSEADFLSF